MKRNNASISIVIPARDSEATLQTTLDSIQKQTLLPDEVIIVDDGSKTPVQNLDYNYSMKILRNPESLGPAAARNRGAQAAEGDIILFVDADVFLSPDVTLRISKILNTMTDTCAVQGVYSQKVPDGYNVFTRYQNHYYHYVFKRIANPYTAICATYCFAIRRNIFLDMGGFDTRIVKPTVEDEAFGYSLANAGHTIYLDTDCRVMHLAKYNFSQLIFRKFRMSFFQAGNFFSGVKPPLLNEAGQNKTHHPADILFAVVLSPLLFLALCIKLPVFAVVLFVYISANIRFWRFLNRIEAPVFFVEMLFITWVDQVTIFIGLAAGTLHYFVSLLFNRLSTREINQDILQNNTENSQQ